MEEAALAAPVTCTNSLHIHAFPRDGKPLRTLRREGGKALALSGVAHDARNLITALRLCAELVAEPGVLGPGHGHYAVEIRSIADAAGQLVQRLSRVGQTSGHGYCWTDEQERGQANVQLNRQRDQQQDWGAPVIDLARGVQELRALLAAVASPAIVLDVQCLPCAGALRLTEESLTRILMNLVRNAGDAMPGGGHIRITAQKSGGGNFLWTVPGLEEIQDPSGQVLLTIEDDGPGIPVEMLDAVFEPGFSTRRGGQPWPETPHRGLGLSIVRDLVEEAGGVIRAVVPPGRGARFEIELPLTNVTPSLPSERVLVGGSAAE